MSPLGVITGLIRETRYLCVLPAGGRPAVRCHGPGPARAAEAATALLAEGCGALLSYGVAGGLDPALAPGTPVVAEAVISPDGARFSTDGAWRAGLLASLEDESPHCAPIAGSDRVVIDPPAKRRLFEATGAAAVDMESHAVAALASAAGVPFLALRVVSDPAGGTVARSALKGVDRQGRDRPWAVAAALLRHPGELADLLRLRRDDAVAGAALRRAAAVAGPGFGLG